MTRIDLDDLPPRIARALAGLQPGEEILLIEKGLVCARLTVSAPAGPGSPPPESPDIAPAEVMEHFRSIVDEEF